MHGTIPFYIFIFIIILNEYFLHQNVKQNQKILRPFKTISQIKGLFHLKKKVNRNDLQMYVSYSAAFSVRIFIFTNRCLYQYNKYSIDVNKFSATYLYGGLINNKFPFDFTHKYSFILLFVFVLIFARYHCSYLNIFESNTLKDLIYKTISDIWFAIRRKSKKERV